MSGTRMLLEKSWTASKHYAARHGISREVPASKAGEYLDAADGDAERALSMLPDSEEDDRFWPLVRRDLEIVIAEERAERGPRLKTGT
jgi:hypothetical protein